MDINQLAGYLLLPLDLSPKIIFTIIYHGLASLTTYLYHHSLRLFILLFIFRYLRLIIHLISFWSYKPTPIPLNPTITSRDCTVILPTVDPLNPEFTACIQSCLINNPKEIIIVTVGIDNFKLCREIAAKWMGMCPSTNITVRLSQKANKRLQVAIGILRVRTKISVLLDDHVIWGLRFLETALAPFEDEAVGAVGTNKRVRKQHFGVNVLSYWNMLGAIYLERHNFEIRATNTIDGGVFVISGRTSLHRTKILQETEFVPRFVEEMFFFGKFGPLNPDDDNYITRYEVSRGWKVKIQYSDDACIETTLGAYPKFPQQCLRWVRTTWRSNSASLFTDRTVWKSQPWCVYAVYITSFFNFALFNDAGLIYLIWSSEEYGTWRNIVYLGLWIFTTKMVKLFPYFRRHPEDLRMLPGYFAFAYFHSLIKAYAGLTFWNCHWGGRDLDAITAAAGGGGAAAGFSRVVCVRPPDEGWKSSQNTPIHPVFDARNPPSPALPTRPSSISYGPTTQRLRESLTPSSPSRPEMISEDPVEGISSPSPSFPNHIPSFRQQRPARAVERSKASVPPVIGVTLVACLLLAFVSVFLVTVTGIHYYKALCTCSCSPESAGITSAKDWARG